MDEVIEQYRRERSTHVPLDVAGEYAQEDMGANAIVLTVKDRRTWRSTVLWLRTARSMTESFLYDSTVAEASGLLAPTLLFITLLIVVPIIQAFLLASALGVPMGMLAGVYLSEYKSERLLVTVVVGQTLP